MGLWDCVCGASQVLESTSEDRLQQGGIERPEQEIRRVYKNCAGVEGKGIHMTFFSFTTFSNCFQYYHVNQYIAVGLLVINSFLTKIFMVANSFQNYNNLTTAKSIFAFF